MRTRIFKTLALVTAGTSIIGCNSLQKKESKQPNILYIMSDDHAYSSISAYGYGLNETPNIDRLAREGAIFTKACVTNSISASSRAVLLMETATK